jgi:DNA transformation protein
MPQSTPIDLMRNLGPQSRRWLEEIDIQTEADLRAIGAVEAYARLRFRFGKHITCNMLHALAAALDGVDWRALSSETKALLNNEAEARLSLLERRSTRPDQDGF